tara:strand:- start:1209 stop:2018 length:810 start_codon:yes stop_codon:yes gene_type:complete
MAAEEQTFTVDTTPPTETVGDNLTPDEQDSLAVGEQMVEEQEQLLAGKYKNAEELEKAYKELESKLGQKDTEEEAKPEPEAEPEPTSLSDNATVIADASDEFYANDGKLSPETLQKFQGMSSQDLVNAYLEVTKSPDWQAAPPAQVQDVTESQINEVKNFAGGAEEYQNMVQWAGQNLDAQAIKAFDDIVASGSIETIKFAVSGLKSQYLNAVGYEGKMVQGKAAKETADVFRSQAELVQAMSDKRYDRDPAYRQDIIEKLERSDNLSF